MTAGKTSLDMPKQRPGGVAAIIGRSLFKRKDIAKGHMALLSNIEAHVAFWQLLCKHM